MTQIDMFEKQAALSAAQKEMLARIVLALEGMKCKFGIVTPDGQEFGPLKMIRKKPVPEAPKKPVNKPRRYPYGAIRGYVQPFMKDMAVGESQAVPPGEFSVRDVANAVSSYAHQLWGSGNYTVSSSELRDAVVVTRKINI